MTQLFMRLNSVFGLLAHFTITHLHSPSPTCFLLSGLLGFASKFAIAQTTAIIAGFISYPFDTVRRRLQMQSEKPKEQWLYSGTVDCAVKVIKDEGVGAMFKGFGANVLRTLGGALVLVGYDEIKRIINV